MRMGKQRILRYSYTTLFVECWIFWANHLSLSSSPDHTPHSVGGLPAFYLVVLFFVPGAGIWAAPRPSLTKLLPSFCLEVSVTGWMWWWHWLSQCHDMLVEICFRKVMPLSCQLNKPQVIFTIRTCKDANVKYGLIAEEMSPLRYISEMWPWFSSAWDCFFRGVHFVQCSEPHKLSGFLTGFSDISGLSGM